MVHLISNLLNKLRRQKSVALVQVLPANRYGTWFQVVQGTNRGGYLVRCCGTEGEFAATEAQRSENRICGCCKGPLNLLRSIDAIAQDGNFKQDLAARLSNLAIKPYATSAPAAHCVVPISDYSIGETYWAGEPPSPGVLLR